VVAIDGQLIDQTDSRISPLHSNKSLVQSPKPKAQMTCLPVCSARYSNLLDRVMTTVRSMRMGRTGTPMSGPDGRPVRSLGCKVCSSREEALRCGPGRAGGLALRGSGPWLPRDDRWSSCLFTGQGLETASLIGKLPTSAGQTVPLSTSTHRSTAKKCLQVVSGAALPPRYSL
jgi:hypothetical protein